MEKKELTPSESLALITSVIVEAKSRFHENGFSFIFLGSCMFIAGFAQFLLLKMGYFQINYYPYFIMPVAGIVVIFYYKKKRKKDRSQNIISSVLKLVGLFLGINLTIAGFLFWEQFAKALMPFMLVLFAISPLITGILLKNKYFTYAGIVINILAYCSFYIESLYQPLLLSLISIIGLVTPGIMLYKANIKENV